LLFSEKKPKEVTNHPDVAVTLNNLAMLWRSRAGHREAEALARRALVILEKALGPRHPNVIATRTNSACINGRRAAASPSTTY
jgi:hypothetical protein